MIINNVMPFISSWEVAKGLGSIDAIFGLIFKMADVTRYDSTRFGNYKNGVLIHCMAGYHDNAHISKITVLKR